MTAPRLTDAYGEHRGEWCVFECEVFSSDRPGADFVALRLRGKQHGISMRALMSYADTLAVRDMLNDVLARAVQS